MIDIISELINNPNNAVKPNLLNPVPTLTSPVQYNIEAPKKNDKVTTNANPTINPPVAPNAAVKIPANDPMLTPSKIEYGIASVFATAGLKLIIIDKIKVKSGEIKYPNKTTPPEKLFNG